MINKKEEAKRLAIYLIVVFITAALPIFLRKPMKQSETFYFVIATGVCFFPAIANLVTRKVTKEGFQNMKLHLHLKGNFKWYLLSFFLPVITISFSIILSGFVNHEKILADGIDAIDIVGTLLMSFSQMVFFSFQGIGEELGWRAYMNQKMEILFGNDITCILGGIIWALWHVPGNIATVMAGQANMTEILIGNFERAILLISLGVFLMFITKKTDTVWPAVVGHITYNMSISASAQIFGEANAFANSREIHWIMFVPFLIVGIIFWVINKRTNVQ